MTQRKPPWNGESSVQTQWFVFLASVSLTRFGKPTRRWASVQKERGPTNSARDSANTGDLYPLGIPWSLQAIVVCCNQS